MAYLATILLSVVFVALYLFALHRGRLLAFRSLNEHAGRSPDAIAVLDASSNITYWNAAATRMFGYEPAEIIGRGIHEVLAGECLQTTGQGEALGQVTELTARRKDATEFPVEFSLSVMRSGKVRGAVGIIRDMTQRKLAADQLHRRDRILDSITAVTLELLSTTALDEAMPKLLGMIGEAVGSDRVIVLINNTKPDGSLLIGMHSAWSSQECESPFQPMDLAENPGTAAVMGNFFRNLPRGEVFAALPRTIPGQAGAFLRGLNVRSILLAPVPGEQGIWGYLGVEDCHTEREWESAEIEGVKVLGEIIGAALGRLRRIEELADAKRIVESSTTVLYRLKEDSSLPLTYISENVSRWGYRPSQFTDAPNFYVTIVHPDDQERVGKWIAGILAIGITETSMEMRVRFADGSYRWFKNRISITRPESGQPLSLEGTLIDITEQKIVEEKLNFSNILLTTAIESTPDGILVVDMEGRVLSLNQRFLEMWKIPPHLADAKLEYELLKEAVPTVKDPQGFAARVRHVYERPGERFSDEIDFLDGRVFERNSAGLHDPANRQLGRIWFFRDVTERKRTERELEKLARTDALTELANRATFAERMDLAFAASRRGAVPFALLFLDIDCFKDVNDTRGHHVGDLLLRQAAGRMVGALRKTDLVARFGGDEFAILQTDAADISAAAALAAEIRAVLTEPFEIDGNQLRITASVGIAFYTQEVSDAAEILEQADRALYLAKQEGKNRFRFYSLELDRQAHEGMSLSGDLEAAIANHELELRYQPQVAVATGTIVGVEALVRWHHPTRDELKPGSFIPAAERTGVIVPLGQWVLESACRQYRQWRDEGVAPPAVALNLSGAQLKLRRDFPRDVAAMLKKWGLSPRDLEFEVSEAVLAASSDWQPDTLRQLRDLGVGLTIDDFGCDYTVIGRVRAYGVKRFKIAPQFIGSMASDPASAAVVRTMISLADQLGVELIAKHVETERQERFLLSITESAEAQGYFYSEPLSPDAMTALLRRKHSSAGTAPATHPDEPGGDAELSIAGLVGGSSGR